jgi:hypothetical protein
MPWPRTLDALLALDEIPYDRYLRHAEVREAPPADALLQGRDEHGTLWRVVNLCDAGMRRVRLS